MAEQNSPIERIPNHTHNGVDSPFIGGESIAGCPLPAMTAQAGSLSTGGSAVLTTEDSDTIVNTINRVTELEDKLRSIGIIL